jgi:hypothetical protein
MLCGMCGMLGQSEPQSQLIFGLTPAQFALLVAVMAIIFTVMRWRSLSARRNRPRPDAISEAVGASPLNVREITTEVQALLADLEETSRRLTAQIDNRYTRLEQLMAEADQKIKRLEALTGAEGRTAPAVAEAQSALQRLRQERGAPAATEDPAYQPIFALADRGKSSREIAQELGRQPGEIELILALRQRQKVS